MSDNKENDQTPEERAQAIINMLIPGDAAAYPNLYERITQTIREAEQISYEHGREDEREACAVKVELSGVGSDADILSATIRQRRWSGMSDGFSRGPVMSRHWTELDAAREEIERLRQREARLWEALEPFARAARRYMDMADGLPDDTEVTIGGEATQPLPYVTLDDLRRAALKETEPGE